MIMYMKMIMIRMTILYPRLGLVSWIFPNDDDVDDDKIMAKMMMMMV